MRSAHLFFHQSPEAPFRGSCSIANSHVRDVLAEIGYDTHCIHGDGREEAPAARFLPFPLAEKVRQIQELPEADLAVYCDFGLQLHPLRRGPRRRNVVLFHGLAGLPGHWLGNPDLDMYWGNSGYLRDVLCSLLALPDFGSRSLLDSRAFDAVGSVTLPLACLDPDTFRADGRADLPDHVRRAIEGDDVLGHCLADGKLDQRAVFAILLLLNQIAAEHGLGRRFRLFVGERTAGALYTAMARPAAELPAEMAQLQAALARLGASAEDLFLPVPSLAQPALFELMRACRFGLFYNWVPESFGFYALESVYHGCPVYTNGVGNLRHLLPLGCGIEVHETEAMAFGDVREYLAVARTIFVDATGGRAATEERCRRGAAYIAATYNRDALRRDVAAHLERLEAGAAGGATEFEALVVRLGPLVRSWDPATRGLVSDYETRRLDEEEAAVVEGALGATAGELAHGASPRVRALLEGLFRDGVLALAPS